MNSFSDVAGGLVRDSGKLPANSEPVDVDGVHILPFDHPRTKSIPKPIGILHLFQTEAAWKQLAVQKNVHTINLKTRKLKHPAHAEHNKYVASAPIVRTLISKNAVPAITDISDRQTNFVPSVQIRKRNRGKYLSPMTVLRAYENSILIKNKGHLADERELQSLKSTAHGLR